VFFIFYYYRVVEMPKYVEEYYESSECDSFDDSEGDEPPSKRKRRGPNTGQSPIRR